MFRNQLGAIVRILIWPTLISTGCVNGLRLCLGHWASMHTLDLTVFALHAGMAVALICGLVLAQWEMSIRGLALVRIALSLDVNYSQSYSMAKKRKWAAFLLYNLWCVLPTAVILFWLGAAFGFFVLARAQPVLSLFLTVVYCLDGFLLTVTVSWCLLFTSLAFAVLACENLGLRKVLSRSIELTVRYLWRGGSFHVLLIICQAATMLAIDLPLIATHAVHVVYLYSNGLSPHRLAYETPAYIQILACASNAVASIVLVGVAMLADALYYHDLRIRMDGHDILIALARMSA